MPDLTDLVPLNGRLIVRSMIPEPSLSQKARLYRKIYVRLLDKAVREYKSARDMVIAQIEERQRPREDMVREGRIIYMHLFVDDMENCINAIHRLCSIMERIKSEPISLVQYRDARRQIESLDGFIIDIRNAVEHMDKEIRKDQITPEQPIALMINENGDRISILDFEIKCADLAIILRNMHKIGEYILQPTT